ncbi:transporter [Bacillus paralicheniformis]|nr:transporter [Bacillus paralicheniformis]
MYPYDPSLYDPYRQQFPPGPASRSWRTAATAVSPPPPSQFPQDTGPSVFAVDPGGIRRCLFKYTFIRLRNGSRFWFYPVFVGRYSIAGYRWRPRQFRWVYFGIDLNEITSFSCQ